MKLDEIELKICTGELTAAQVFTQMKQHVESKSEWISVDDRLPEPSEDHLENNLKDLFLCILDDGHYQICFYESWGWESEEVNRRKSDVIKWSRIQPPQEVK